MMRESEFLSTSMTKLETMLKSFYLQRPDLHNKIITSNELSNYISWMASTYNAGFGERFTLDTIPEFAYSSRHCELAESFLKKPNDSETLALLSKDSAMQSEDCCISANQDISAGRILRYLPAHWHTTDCFQVYYALTDKCTVHFARETVELKKGAVLIIAPGVLHATPSNSDDVVLPYFVIRSSTFDRVFWNQLSESWLLSQFFHQALSGKESTAYLHFDTYGDTEVLDIISKIALEFSEHRAYRNQMLNMLMSTFFITLLRKYEGTAKLPRTESFFWKHEYSAIFSFIQSNFIHTTIADVAEKFHYSEKQISRIVRQSTGLSYAQLVLKMKMEKAVTLLRYGNSSASSIAAELGYSDVSCFYRAFTKYYQKTPVEYMNCSDS